MAVRVQSLWRFLGRWGSHETKVELPVAKETVVEPARRMPAPTVEIAPNDPLVAYFQTSPGTVEIERLDLDSPALRALKAAGVRLVVPLVSQGELIGLLNLGPRLSEQDYSADDRGLLNNLGTQAAPAVRVAQLVRQQKEEAAERERIAQELRVARLIQQTLLPRQVPTIAGWEIAAYYKPAREVGGDFYDFITLPDGQLGLVIGDVTDKGVPAALVMATTRAILRAASEGSASPGAVLERVNNTIHPDIPPKMFVTCLFAVLDPTTGRLRFANAGHDLPYLRHQGGVAELRATGMPLGLLPDMRYEEKEVTLGPGESVLFYSDGLVEAHNTGREMFSFPRLATLMGQHVGGAGLIDFLLAQLTEFTGSDWEQEDDVTLVTLQRSASNGDDDSRLLAEFTLPSDAGNERLAMERVAEVVQSLGLSSRRLERLKTAVAEATMNAIEHGNKYQSDLLVQIQVLATNGELAVRITDHGGGNELPTPVTPDLDAKLAGLQSPRGWGLFLIKNMVDEMNITTDETHHTVELILHLEGDNSADETA